MSRDTSSSPVPAKNVYTTADPETGFVQSANGTKTRDAPAMGADPLQTEKLLYLVQRMRQMQVL